MFSKMLQQLSVAEAGEVIAGLGFDGVDLTVREKGHVLPENVTRELAPAVALLRDKGLVVGMLTTSITRADQPHAEEVFRTAAECGVRFLKLGYWLYRGFGAVRQQIDEIRVDLQGLEALALRYGVKAALHTHSGNFMTAAMPICARLVEDTDPDAIGIYVDGGHVVLEGGYGTWRQGLDLISDRICLLAAKSFGWFPEPNGATGRMHWRPQLLPFDRGMTDWRELFTLLRSVGFDGLVSVHSEYSELSLEDLVKQTREDFRILKAALAQAE
jgi:sugar phosphate isomerase/epimerase